MKRGMLTISKQELQAILPIIPVTQDNQLILGKIQAGIKDPQDSVTLLVSEAEAELILDHLPAPPESSPEINQARTTISTYLFNLK